LKLKGFKDKWRWVAKEGSAADVNSKSMNVTRCVCEFGVLSKKDLDLLINGRLSTAPPPQKKATSVCSDGTININTHIKFLILLLLIFDKGSRHPCQPQCKNEKHLTAQLKIRISISCFCGPSGQKLGGEPFIYILSFLFTLKKKSKKQLSPIVIF
jgi:hypothetical protein